MSNTKKFNTFELWKRLIQYNLKQMQKILKNNRGEIVINEDAKCCMFNPVDYIFFKNSEEKYAVQLGMLNTLLEEKLLNQKEYEKAKCYLKQRYKIA